MDSVYLRLKNFVKHYVSLSRQTRAEIAQLKWKPEHAEEARRLQRVPSTIAPTGRKKTLKGWARPETGPQRYSLWDEKRSLGRGARTAHLLYAIIRGIPYVKVESNAKTRPWAKGLHAALQPHLTKEQGALLSVPSIEKWLDGEPIPQAFLDAMWPPKATKESAQAALGGAQ